METRQLVQALNVLIEEAGKGSQRLAEVLAEQEQTELRLQEACWTAATDEEYQHAWSNLQRAWADHDATMDTMAGWNERANERALGAFYQSSESKPSPSS